MFVSLGRRPRERGDLVDLLRDCHSRIRAFGDLAVELAARSDLPSPEVTDACARIERYFVEALPLHVRDEEDSVRPRLHGCSPTVDAVLLQVEEQHELHGALVDRLCGAVRALGAAPDYASARVALGSIAEPLRTLMEAHLRAEEDVIFPAIRSRLSTSDQEDILWEMRNRRTSAEGAPK
jgi:iron-sulfur cluster repair protein YtfE (RIC family)